MSKNALITGSSHGIGAATAIALAKYGIRVNCIAPGLIMTKLVDRYKPEHLEGLPILRFWVWITGL